MHQKSMQNNWKQYDLACNVSLLSIIQACKDPKKNPVEIIKLKSNNANEFGKLVLPMLQEKYLAQKEKEMAEIQSKVEEHIGSLQKDFPEYKPDPKLQALPEELKARIQ